MALPPVLPGYDSPAEFEYPTLWMNVGAGVLAVVCLVGFLLVAAAVRGDLPDLEFGVGGLLVIVLAWPGTIILHELVHGAVANALGYRVSYGFAWSMLAAYAGTFEQSLARRDGIVIAAAPVALLTPPGTALLAVADGPLFLAALFGLAINTSSATGDAYLVYRLARLPPGSILYSFSEEEMYVYEPATGRAGVEH